MRPEQRLPWVTLALVFSNLIMAFAVTVNPSLIQQFGFVPVRPEWPTAVTSLFLHLNLLHLLGNMAFLATVGPYAEGALGFGKYFAVYLAGGLVGVLAHWAFARTSSQPLIGASGAVAAVAGYSAVRFYFGKVPLFPRVQVPIAWLLILWTLLQVLGGFVRLGLDTGGPAFWAHLGGVLTGLIAALVFRASADAATSANSKALRAAVERGPEAAIKAATTVLSNDPNSELALLTLASAQLTTSQQDAASQTALRGYKATKNPQFLSLLIGAERLTSLSAESRRAAAKSASRQDPELARALLRSVLDEPTQSALHPDVLLDLAELHEGEQKRKLLDQLLDSFPMHPAAEIGRARRDQS